MTAPRPLISLIVAVDEAGGIGYQGGLPWHLPAELARFKRRTMGHHLLMGRKTYETIGRPLPGRISLVLSSTELALPQGAQWVTSVAAAIELAAAAGENELFVIGGGQIFAQTLPIADRLYLTEVAARLPADTYFPAWELDAWIEQDREVVPADQRNPYAFVVRTLVRQSRPNP
jgi:dihydrofolate reductase